MKTKTRTQATKQRLRVRSIPFGDFTEDGRFYPTIDGKAWGEKGRAFWPTKAEAMRVGIRCLTKLVEHEARSRQGETAA